MTETFITTPFIAVINFPSHYQSTRYIRRESCFIETGKRAYFDSFEVILSLCY